MTASYFRSSATGSGESTSVLSASRFSPDTLLWSEDRLSLIHILSKQKSRRDRLPEAERTEALSPLSVAELRKYEAVKKAHPDALVCFAQNGYFELYGKDAEKAAPLLGTKQMCIRDRYITNPPADYDVNPEYLNDEKFATLITEAEKYLGYPYVWGGSNPDTSFDCSGFVSYVLTNSGLVNTGRLGAQGLYNVCTPVSKANAQPGDLIFFVGTYDTPGVSHVGIYVGDGVMIHCGDPIQYTSINSSYWQQHFYAFGRPAY